ncbi:TetR family transcriptional regulator [Ferrovibrio sp.]|uniref:TetR family transcriptional regulator n=1 Tax=Ferrovibrio sp. TaxID=1917215 RepID=UPI0025C6AF72|nr:TetR family transcriptional regulator [Ferrovibrio sp.]MBX3454677.1 TetR family transcriptional regulator [Ferrovibrio sp.]
MRAKKKPIGAPVGPRAANVAETKEKILRAAIDQFAQNGFAGARIDVICEMAGVNARMIYHYYDDKAGLYVAVLEHVLGQLRTEELKLDVTTSEPLEGLISMFNFTFEHFSRHPELIRLLSAENLEEAKFLKESIATPTVASPVLDQIGTLLKRGQAQGTIRAGIPPLHLYVTMVALAYFHKSNGYTLAAIFDKRVLSKPWQNEHYSMAREILATYLKKPA